MEVICKPRQQGKTQELLLKFTNTPNGVLVVATDSQRDEALNRIERSDELRGKIKPWQIKVAKVDCLRGVGGPAFVDDADCILAMLMCYTTNAIDTISITD